MEDAGHHNPAFNPPFSASFTYPSNQLDPSTALRPVQGFPPVGFADGRFDNRFLNINGRPYDFPAAYSQQWNLTLGRQLRDYDIEVAYVGNKANKLMANRNINQPLPGAGSVNSRRIFPGWGSITFQEPHWLTTAISNSRCGSSGELTQGRPPQRLGEFVDAHTTWQLTIPIRRSSQPRAEQATCRTSATSGRNGLARSRTFVTG